MGVTKEAFVDLQEKYEKIKKLIEEDSKLDPESEPYISKYAARQLLISMKANLEKLLDQSNENSEKLTAMLGAVWYYLGMISVDTEELSTGEIQLNKSISLVENYSLKPEFVLVMLNALNQLGILWSHRDDSEKSKEYLERSQKLYADFKDLNIAPVCFNDLFRSSGEKNEEESYMYLEKTHTLTLYYLAQIYGSLKDQLKSAIYCHVTLKRQLEFNDHEPIDWALNAATLSQFFMEKNGFKQARHHLAAASNMLSIYEAKLNDTASLSEEYDAKMEAFKHRSADVARCWAKYGIFLLSSSRDRLLHHTDDEEDCSMTCTLSSDLAQLQLAPDSTVSSDDLSDLFFPSFDVQVYELQVTDQFVLTFEDARAVFLSIQSWLNEAHLYYTLENHATDYVQIVQDMSQMFNYLAFFEDNAERQSKMHKRRIDLLENAVKELNPTYYLQVCRQIWYELGETYITILEIKMDKLRESPERPTPHALQKINSLIEKSIANFLNFVNSIKETLNTESIEKVHDDLERPTLKAYFHAAVMYGKFITPDKTVQLENTRKSLLYFKKMVDYCDKFEKATVHVKTELGVCREMVMLLPLKIMKISQEIGA
ncbi:uncharacterized protein CBL_11068 [Carabus blaptoides fortunei]